MCELMEGRKNKENIRDSNKKKAAIKYADITENSHIKMHSDSPINFTTRIE